MEQTLDDTLDRAYMKQPYWRYLKDVKGVPAHQLRASWWYRNFILEAYYQTHDISANAILWPPCLSGRYLEYGCQYHECWCCLRKHRGVVPPVMTIVKSYANKHQYEIPGL